MVSKRSYVHVPRVPHRAVEGRRERVWYQGGADRVGTREGYTGVVPSQHAARGEGSITSEAGPGRPTGPGVGGLWSLGAPADPVPTLRARSVHPGGPPWYGSSSPGNAASGPIRARFSVILLKVSQNGIVSPKYHEKAYVSPYFQNGLHKSALEIPGFPFSPAFSHKELMGVF